MYVHCIGRNDSLRIAYIHVVKKGKDGKQSEYYSKLVKADPSGKDQVLFSLITTSN
jgi:callose synthase